MRLLQALFANPGLKLLALLMAWAVWYLAHEDLTESATRVAAVNVVVDGDDELNAYVTNPKDGEVRVEVEGPQRAVSDFQRLPSTTVIATVRADLLQGDDEKLVTLDREQLAFPDVEQTSELRVAKMTPAEVRVKIRRMSVETKPVTPPEGLGERGSVRPVLVDWDKQVQVRGATASLRNVLAIRTFVDEAQLEQYAANMGNEERQTVPFRLSLDPEQAKLFELVGVPHLTAKVELVQVDERDLELPITILRAVDPDADASAKTPLRFSALNEVKNEDFFKKGPPASVLLRFRGVPRALESLDAKRLLAFVLESDLPPGETTGGLHVRVQGMPPGVSLVRDYELAVESGR